MDYTAYARRTSLRHLRSFMAVAELGSLTKAATALCVTQSALSLTIHHLEEDLGIKLFDRTTRRIELTLAGEELLPAADRLIRDFDGTLRDMRALSRLKEGTVSIAAVPSIMSLLLPEVAKAYAHDFPSINVTLREETSRNVHSRVLQGGVDFGVANVWQANPDLEFEPLFDDYYVVVFAPDHAFNRRRKPIDWEDLSELQIVGFGGDNSLRQQLVGVPGILDRIKKPAYVASDASAIENMVRTGLGVSVMPAFSAQRPPLTRLKQKRLHAPECARTMGILSRKGRSASPAAEELKERIRASIPALVRFADIRLHREEKSPQA